MLIHHLVDGAALTDAVRRTVEHLTTLDGHEETTEALRRAAAAWTGSR